MIQFVYRTALTVLFLSTLPGEQEFTWAVDGSPNGLFLMTTVVPTIGTTKATNSTTASTEDTFAFTMGPLEAGETYSPLHQAIRRGNYKQAMDLMANGADVNQRTASGKTALHLAVLSDNRPIVIQLLAQGASPLIKDNAGKMPIDYWESGNDIYTLHNLQACEKDATSTACTHKIR